EPNAVVDVSLRVVGRLPNAWKIIMYATAYQQHTMVGAVGVELIRAIENMEGETSGALGSPPRPPFLSLASRFCTVVSLEHASLAVIERAISFTFMVFLHSVDLRQMDPGFSMFSMVLMVETRNSTAWAGPVVAVSDKDGDFLQHAYQLMVTAQEDKDVK